MSDPESETAARPTLESSAHADDRPSDDKTATDDGWTRCLEWFKRHGVA